MLAIRDRRSLVLGLIVFLGLTTGIGSLRSADAQQPGQPSSWQRFYNYPYVYYPHNFQKIPESYDHLYYKYPTEKRIPVYRSDWYNFYPSDKPYHWGHHYILDTL